MPFVELRKHFSAEVSKLKLLSYQLALLTDLEKFKTTWRNGHEPMKLSIAQRMTGIVDVQYRCINYRKRLLEHKASDNAKSRCRLLCWRLQMQQVRQR